MTDPRIEAAARAIFADDIEHSRDKLERYPSWEGMLAAARIMYMRKARVALAAADAAAWREIESAPRDGTYVDLWVINSDGEGRRITDAYFGSIPHTCGEYGQFCDSCPEEGNFWIDGIFGHEIHSGITHWQPLPAPPAAELGGRNG